MKSRKIRRTLLQEDPKQRWEDIMADGDIKDLESLMAKLDQMDYERRYKPHIWERKGHGWFRCRTCEEDFYFEGDRPPPQCRQCKIMEHIRRNGISQRTLRHLGISDEEFKEMQRASNEAWEWCEKNRHLWTEEE